MSRITVLALIVLSGLLLWSDAPAAGEGTADIWPALRTLPAPSWVKEGVRLSYYSRALSIPSVMGSYVRDDNGDWVGTTSGKRYRWEDAPAPGGHGVTQVDIVSLDRNSAVLATTAFQYYNVTGPLVGVQQGCEVGLPAAGSDYWVHPSALKQIPQRLGPGLKILRMPFRLGNRVIQTLRIQRETDSTRHVYMFDLETGMLVHMNGAARDLRGKSTLCTDMTLLGTRQLQPPWARAPLPDWLGQGATLKFSGRHTNIVTQPQPHPFSVPLSGTAQVTARNHNAAVYDQTITMTVAQGMPPHVDRRRLCAGSWQLGGMALPPRGLAALRPNQVIDRDEVTKVTTIVKSTGVGAQGRRVVVLRAANQAGGMEGTYDVVTGALIKAVMTQNVSYFHRSETELVLTGMTAGTPPRRPPGAGQPPPRAPKPPLAPEPAPAPTPAPAEGESWDALATSVIEKLQATNLNIGTYVRVLKRAACRIALTVTVGGGTPQTVQIQYAWDDKDDDGALSASEVQVSAAPVSNPQFQRFLDDIVKGLVAMTTTSVRDTFRPYRVRAQEAAEGFLLTLTPLQGAVGGGRMTVAPDYRILRTEKTDPAGNAVSVAGTHVRLADAWLPDKSTQTVTAPGGRRVAGQTIANTYRMHEGVPMAVRTVIAQTAAVQGGTLELKQDYVYNDWQVVKRVPVVEPPVVLEPATLVGAWAGAVPDSKRWTDWVFTADGQGMNYLSERRKVRESAFTWKLAEGPTLELTFDVGDGKTATLPVRCRLRDARTLVVQQEGGPEVTLTRLGDAPATHAERKRALVGIWRDMHLRHKEDTLEYRADGSFTMKRVRSYGTSQGGGGWTLDEDGRLEILPDGKTEPMVARVTFLDTDNYIARSAEGHASRVVRVRAAPRD